MRTPGSIQDYPHAVRFMERFGLRCPIVQAPTGSIAGPELATAVAEAGGMGALALTWTPPEQATQYVHQVCEATNGPFLVNFALAFPPLALPAALEAGARIITFSWGDAAPYVKAVRAAGATFGVQVTNIAGARHAIALGADFLVCQGMEAGGHIQSSTYLRALLPQIVATAGETPVVAAGGMAQGRDIARILLLRGAAAMFGTRFVATRESRAHPEYKQRLTQTDGEETALTLCFEDGWPQAMHRVLRNTTLEAWESLGSPARGRRPSEGDIVGATAEGAPILRYEDTAPRAGFTGDIEAMCLYAGMGCDFIHDVPPAGDVVARLWAETQPFL